ERESIINLLEEISGARMLFHYVRIGGVRNDVTDDWLRRVRAFVDDFISDKLPQYHRLITGNRLFVRRTKGIAVLTPEDAIAWGAAGPVLRGSGVARDLRKEIGRASCRERGGGSGGGGAVEDGDARAEANRGS